MQLFLEVLNDVLEFREIFRGRLDQGLVSFQHRLRPSGAVFFQRYWKSLPVLFYGASSFSARIVSIVCSISFTSGGRVIEMMRARAPASSMTSIALSGRKRPVIYRSESRTAASSASSVSLAL